MKNGRFCPELSDMTRLQAHVKIESIADTASPYMPYVYARLVQQQKKEIDPFALYCQSQLKGLLILVQEKAKLESPLQILFINDAKEFFPAFNVYMHLGKQSKIECVMTTIANSLAPSTSYVDIELESEAELECVRAHSDSYAMMLDFMRVHLKEQAKAKVVDLQKPKASSKFHLHMLHESMKAESSFYALSLVDEKKIITFRQTLSMLSKKRVHFSR